ncbi:hypothetical protein HDK64DRAFT_283221 [Phyllosticta capitalensis]
MALLEVLRSLFVLCNQGSLLVALPTDLLDPRLQSRNFGMALLLFLNQLLKPRLQFRRLGLALLEMLPPLFLLMHQRSKLGLAILALLDLHPQSPHLSPPRLQLLTALALLLHERGELILAPLPLLHPLVQLLNLALQVADRVDRPAVLRHPAEHRHGAHVHCRGSLSRSRRRRAAAAGREGARPPWVQSAADVGTCAGRRRRWLRLFGAVGHADRDAGDGRGGRGARGVALENEKGRWRCGGRRRGIFDACRLSRRCLIGWVHVDVWRRLWRWRWRYLRPRRLWLRFRLGFGIVGRKDGGLEELVGPRASCRAAGAAGAPGHGDAAGALWSSMRHDDGSRVEKLFCKTV